MRNKIGFIGLGLIGGSIAKAIRHYHPECQLVAFDKNKESLALATQESIIDVAATTIDDNFRNCRYIFLCAPVSYNSAYISQVKDYLDDECILTDVGSVKNNIHKEVIKQGVEEYFIGGHPMAGSEKSGYANSKAMLIENAYYIVTPTAKSDPAKVEEFASFIDSLRALPVTLDYEEHDVITGTISHLPHVIAATLVNFVKRTDSEEEYMKTLAAGGFKDITRIASSSPTMWQHICAKNKDNLVAILDEYMKDLTEIRDVIAKGNENGVYDLFDRSRNYRNSIPEGAHGPIKRAYALYCDIIDEAGAFATIATILASNNISIKNIGIIHNREFEDGVLRIEFYDRGSSERASELLRKYRYTVYDRS